MDIRVDWADFRTPPINLWVMPQWRPDWRETGGRLPHHRVAPFPPLPAIADGQG